MIFLFVKDFLIVIGVLSQSIETITFPNFIWNEL